jgi:hypothetical protein
VGAIAAVLVAALILAQVPPRWIGIVGVVSLAVVPLVVLGGGLPTSGEVSPTFVSRTLVPHHLTFVGLVLVSTWAVLELAPHLHREPVTGEEQGAASGAQGEAPAAGQVVAAALLVAAVAAGAFVAVQAVWQA